MPGRLDEDWPRGSRASRRRDAPLGARTTYRVGGRAACWWRRQTKGRWRHVTRLSSVGRFGPGTRDRQGLQHARVGCGVPRARDRLGGEFEAVEIDRESTVRAGGAVGLQALARQTAASRPHRIRVGGRDSGLDRGSGPDERRGTRLADGGCSHAGPYLRSRVGFGTSPVTSPSSRPATAGAPSDVTEVVVRGRARSLRVRAGRSRSRRSARSSGGASRTSPGDSTPARCSRTPRATRPAGSSTPPV